MKELYEKITIIVPLKGREQCTFRFLDLLSKDLEYLGNPIKIIFADGGDKDLSRELLHYTNVNCEYRKFPYDSTLTDFHSKMFETVKSIRTEYCVIIDNDDYFTTNGILYIVGYLENHLNMSSARGSVKRFYNNNPQKLYENIYGTYLCSIVGLSSEERIIEQSKGPHSNWHNVMRTTDAIKSFGLLSIADPTNFRFTGQIIDYLSVVWGNSIRLNDIDFIYHGEGSERIKGIEEHFPPQNKWITQTDWTENFRKMVDAVSVASNFKDENGIEQIKKSFRKSYMLKIPEEKQILKYHIDKEKKLPENDDRIEKMRSFLNSL